jgi:hypothetical protein
MLVVQLTEEAMSDESAPQQPEFASSSSRLPDIENLADSEDAELVEARAKLLEAQAELTRASVPLFDKLVIRGVLPIAIAIVGPWALWKFDASQVEQKKQGQTITALQKLLEAEREDAKARQARSIVWRARMKVLEEEKAIELVAMSTMVCRLDDMLKVALIQAAVSRVIGLEVADPGGTAPSMPTREVVVRDAREQVQVPGLDPLEIDRIAGQQYDRMAKNRRK